MTLSCKTKMIHIKITWFIIGEYKKAYGELLLVIFFFFFFFHLKKI